MSILYGWQRKLSLLPLSLVVVGWVVFSVGFIWQLADWPKEEDSSRFLPYYPRTSPVLFCQYLVLVGGPFVYLLGVAQAILPGIASSIVGVLTAFVSSVYLVSAGFLAYGGADYIRIILELRHEAPLLTLDTKVVLMFVGTAFITLCWCFVLMLTVSYKTKPKRNDGDCQYDIFNPPQGAIGSEHRRRKCRAPFTPGVARGLSVPFIILSLAGWCVFTVGVEKLDNDKRLNENFNKSPLATYGAIVVGPLLYLAAILHAGCWGGASTAMGVFSSILGTVYTVFIGFIVVTFGKDVYTVCQLETTKPNCSINHSSLDIYLIYIFAGGVGSLFLWSFVLMLRPFYRDHAQRGPGDNVINSSPPPTQYGTLRMEESFNNSYSSQPLIAESGKR
jgi:hypothetical protein